MPEEGIDSDLAESERMGCESPSSGEECDASADHQDDDDEHVPLVEAHNCVGLKDWDKAASSRARCCVCNLPIKKNEYRLDYRFKQSDRLADQKRLHYKCVTGIPVDTRVRDIAQVQRWLDAAVVAVDHDMLTHVLSCLRD